MGGNDRVLEEMGLDSGVRHGGEKRRRLHALRVGLGTRDSGDSIGNQLFEMCLHIGIGILHCARFVS